MPRIAGRQTHRANAPADTPFDYFLFNMCLPFLDHLLQGLNSRFDKHGSLVHYMYGLIPSLIGEKEVDIKETIGQYKSDLPSPLLVDKE